MEGLGELIAYRLKDEDSLPRARKDRAKLVLAIEGGGMTGAVSGGMCLFLERAGYTRLFDNIYGCSSGALNGSYTSLGQAFEGIQNYLDMSGQLLRPLDILYKKPPLALDQLFNHIIEKKRPLRFEHRHKSPDFSALVLSQKNYQLQSRSDFRSGKEMALLVRASCTMPVLAGGPTAYKGDLLFDGGLMESIPAFSAIRDGATHVLVLRSQSANYRKEEYPKIFKHALRLYDKQLSDLVFQRPLVYNNEANTIQQYKTKIKNRCQQITIKEDISGGPLALNPSRLEVDSWVSKGYQACSYFINRLIK